MSFARTSDGINLFYESAGSGTPIIFVHEFGGSHWSWEPQLNFFARRHRCITFAARGYPPSDIPESVDAYSQARAADDIVEVLDAADIDKAHVVGLSMGGFASLHVALRHPKQVLSVVAAGAGYGAEKVHENYFKGVSAQVAENFEKRGAKEFAPSMRKALHACSFRKKTRAAGACLPIGWRSTTRKAPPTPCVACRCAGPRSTISKPSFARCRRRFW